jgi:predicted PurR-regulated permease PerM
MTVRQQIGYWLLALVVFVLLLWLLRDILLPFVAAMAIAYFLDPLVDKLEARSISRSISTLLVLIGFFLIGSVLLLLMAPVLYTQAVGFAAQLPKLIDSLQQNLLPLLAEFTGQTKIGLEAKIREAIDAISQQALVGVGVIAKQMISGGLAFFNLISLLIVTPIVAFYLLRDFDHMTAKIDSWLPRQHAETVRALMLQIDDVMAGFVRGQGTVCLILGIGYGVALTLVGLQFGLVIGIFSGLISFVPFVGALLGLLLSMLMAVIQFLPNDDFLRLGLTAAVFAAGQMIEGNFLTPKLLGSHIGLHPVWVMFALFAGGALFGFVGIFIAVPAAAMIGVLIRFGLQKYLDSRLFGGPVAEAAEHSDEAGK